MNYKIYPYTVNRARSIGVGTEIGAGCDIGKDVMIGKNCIIQCHVRISNGCRIGNDVFIGPNVSLLNDKYMNGCIEPVVVGDHVKIGGDSTIMAGVIIAKKVMIGAKSLVLDNFPEGSTVFGHPATLQHVRQRRKLDETDTTQ